ncbi:MAG: hypothetical protein KAT68_15580 [Bacteroidales bacterium]|nr:hypothetical protein [Bacteroidales bacterium]
MSEIKTKQKLNELSDHELKILKYLGEIDGTTEEKEKHLMKQGIFDEYKQIHKDYASLIDDENFGLEALKRALFIQWIGHLEPSCFTGIESEYKTDKEYYIGIDRNAELKIVEKLNFLVKENKLDAELKWMFEYYSGWDWLFDSTKFGHLYYLNNLIKENKFHNRTPEFEKINIKTMENRGQMGEYLKSIIEKS